MRTKVRPHPLFRCDISMLNRCDPHTGLALESQAGVAAIDRPIFPGHYRGDARRLRAEERRPGDPLHAI